MLITRFLFIKTIIACFCFFFNSNCFAQQKDSYTDLRDSTIYQTIKIDSLIWMTDNLNFQKMGSFSYQDQCDSCGLLYTFESSINACPVDFRLPTEAEWNNLFKNLGGREETDQNGIYYYGIKDSLMDSNFLELKYCGSFRKKPYKKEFEREFSFCGTYAAYWRASKNNPRGIHFEDFGSSDWVGTVVGDENTGFSIRCVKDVQK